MEQLRATPPVVANLSSETLVSSTSSRAWTRGRSMVGVPKGVQQETVRIPKVFSET